MCSIFVALVTYVQTYKWHLSHVYKHACDTCHFYVQAYTWHMSLICTSIYTWHMCKPICGTCHICKSIQLTPVTFVQAYKWHLSHVYKQTCDTCHFYVQAYTWHMCKPICGAWHICPDIYVACVTYICTRIMWHIRNFSRFGKTCEHLDQGGLTRHR